MRSPSSRANAGPLSAPAANCPSGCVMTVSTNGVGPRCRVGWCATAGRSAQTAYWYTTSQLTEVGGGGWPVVACCAGLAARTAVMFAGGVWPCWESRPLMLLFLRARRGSARVAGLVVAVAFTLGGSVLTYAATAAVGHAGRPAPGPVVATNAGLVRGLATGAADQYRGIPYAAPPVGQLRWRPPQPVAGHPGVVDATSFAPHCAQPDTPLGRGTFGTASTSEDCLYLNVYKPAGSS